MQPVKRNIYKSRTRVPEPKPFRKHLFVGLSLVLLLLLIVYVVYELTRLPLFTIDTIVVEGGETISHDEVRGIVDRELTGAYLRIIPKRFVYLYPRERLLSVVGDVPRIDTVHLYLDRERVLHVFITEYMPHALWCASQEDTEHCYFLNKSGFAFAPAPILTGGALLRHIVQGEQKIEEGAVIAAEKLSSLDHFIDRLSSESGLRASALYYEAGADVRIALHGGGSIRITSDKDLNTAFDNLQSVLQSEEFKHIKPGNFNYIDMRFDNKIFVNEELVPTALGTTTATGTAETSLQILPE